MPMPSRGPASTLVCCLLATLLLACSSAPAEPDDSTDEHTQHNATAADATVEQPDHSDQPDNADEEQQEASKDAHIADVLESTDPEKLVALDGDNDETEDDTEEVRAEGGLGLVGTDPPPDSPATGATTEIHQPHIEGHCEVEDVERTFDARSTAVRYCYEHQLLSNHELQGELTVEFRIEPDGTPGDVTIDDSTLDNEDAQECIQSAVQRLEFTAPDDEQSCQVDVPMEFAPGQTE